MSILTAHRALKSTTMAKIKLTAFVAGIRGSVAGTTFSRNKGGDYVRTKVTPNNPDTAFQQARKNNLTSLAQAWRALTAAQIAAWNAAVEGFKTTDIFGDLKTPSGEQLYMRLNMNLALVGTAAISDPPAPAEVEAPSSFSIDMDVSDAEVNANFAPTVPADHKAIVRFTPQFSPGISNFKNKLRNLTTMAAATTSPQNLNNEWTGRFGTLVAGQKIGAEILFVNTTTGLKSGTLKASAIVQA